MSRILFRRITIAAALAVLLTLAAPAQAAGWNGWASDGNALQSAWQWVASFWAPQAPAHDSKPITKAGLGIDPNGGTTSSATPCQANCERGSGIDPNG
jgi:opacity protein-like surface antigen